MANVTLGTKHPGQQISKHNGYYKAFSEALVKWEIAYEEDVTLNPNDFVSQVLYHGLLQDNGGYEIKLTTKIGRIWASFVEAYPIIVDGWRQFAFHCRDEEGDTIWKGPREDTWSACRLHVKTTSNAWYQPQDKRSASSRKRQRDASSQSTPTKAATPRKRQKRSTTKARKNLPVESEEETHEETGENFTEETDAETEPHVDDESDQEEKLSTERDSKSRKAKIVTEKSDEDDDQDEEEAQTEGKVVTDDKASSELNDGPKNIEDSGNTAVPSTPVRNRRYGTPETTSSEFRAIFDEHMGWPYHLPPLQYFGPVHESSSPDSWGSMHTLEKMLSDVVNGRFEFEAAEGTPSPIPASNVPSDI